MTPELPLDDVNREPAKRSRKRSAWWWVLLTVVVATVAALVAGNLTAGNVTIMLFTFNGVLALVVSLRVSLPIFQELGRRDSTVEPMPWEEWMPLQGRWLRILLATPGMLIVLMMFWGTVFTVLVAAEGAIGWLIVELLAR